MLKQISLSFCALILALQLSAQCIPGTYLGMNADEFVVFSEDSICFRLQTDCINHLYIIGKGSYKYCHGRLKITTTEELYAITSSLEIVPRQDSLYSFHIKHADGTSLNEGLVIAKDINKKNEVIMETDNNGFIDTISLSPFLNKEIFIGSYLNFDESDMRQRVMLKRGFDYEIISHIPSSIVCGMPNKKRIRYNMKVLEADFLEFVFESKGFPRSSCCTSKLVKISESKTMPNEYFKKHIGAILLELSLPNEE